MLDIKLISFLIGIAGSIGIIAAGFGYAYAQFKSGGDKAKDSLIETLQQTATAEKTEKERLAAEKLQLITSHQQQINTLTKELAELKGRFEEQSKKAGEYKQILEGRDPQQVKYMADMAKMAAMAAEYISVTGPMIKAIYERKG